MFRAPSTFLNHGGGPMPLMKGNGNDQIALSFQEYGISFKDNIPVAIVIISAHWEESVPTVHVGTNPPLSFDYSGFPPETYEYKYPAHGNPLIAEKVCEAIADYGLPVSKENSRGWDHGVFVPLMLAFPEANIPVIQISLLKDMDAFKHFELGRALRPLRDQGIAILGSGMSFHNMGAFFGQDLKSGNDPKIVANIFNSWWTKVCQLEGYTSDDRKKQLINWKKQAPNGSGIEVHPREEHWLPLLVVVGAAHDDEKGKIIFSDDIMRGIVITSMQFE
jgi:4,5-DOPA dioxygenase extradiol